jgi:hypothetical protein
MASSFFGRSDGYNPLNGGQPPTPPEKFFAFFDRSHPKDQAQQQTDPDSLRIEGKAADFLNRLRKLETGGRSKWPTWYRETPDKIYNDLQAEICKSLDVWKLVNQNQGTLGEAFYNDIIRDRPEWSLECRPGMPSHEKIIAIEADIVRLARIRECQQQLENSEKAAATERPDRDIIYQRIKEALSLRFRRRTCSSS